MGLPAPDFLDLLAITTAAWVLGFVVPGAPGGVGVREAVMIVLLEPTIGQADSVALALIYRISTTAGDALFALAGLTLQRLGPTAANGG
jgi:glycosyltransferase 2 family protein